MANSSLIDFKIGLYIKGNVTAGQNIFEVHTYQFAQNGHQLAQNRSDATLAQEQKKPGFFWSLGSKFFWRSKSKIGFY